MIRDTALVLAALLAVAAPACAHDTTAPLARVTEGFYTAVLALDQDGIPDAKAQAKLAPYISHGLAQRLADGAAAEHRYAALTKLQAPPLLNGNIFTSSFEGATSFKLGHCERQGAQARCKIALVYSDHDRKPRRWTDTAVLVQTEKGWRLDNIDYGGQWPSSNKGTLRGNLSFAIQNAAGIGG